LGEAVYEQFEVPFPRGDTDDSGTQDNPFDLDGGFILFTPNAGGGYDIRTILPLPTVNSGIVTGTVFDESGHTMQNVEVEVRSSHVPAFRSVTNTDAQGQYTVPDVPCGGGMVTVRATWRGEEVGQGIGIVPLDGGAAVIDLHPVPPAPPKDEGGLE
jgi:hypothetical protein